jgi:hypothetical protein
VRGFIGSLRPRLGRLAGIAVSLLIIAGFAFVLLQIAAGGPIAHATVSDDPTATPLTALATATSAATAPATATVAPRATVTPAGLGPGGPSTPGFTVQSIATASIDMSTDSGYPGLDIESDAPIPTTIGGCGPHVLFYVWFTLTLSNNPTPPGQHEGTTASIGYYFRTSDGSSHGSAAHPLSYMIPSGGTDMAINTWWQMPYTQANGSAQWTELDIVQPNQISYRASYKALCVFSLATAHVSVSPRSYDCATGGDQTFTVTGTLDASFTPDNTSHTVTYFWENGFSTHGTTTPTQTVTFPPGVTSMPVQPETVIGNAASQTAAFQADLQASGADSSVTVTSAC